MPQGRVAKHADLIYSTYTKLAAFPSMEKSCKTDPTVRDQPATFIENVTNFHDFCKALAIEHLQNRYF